MIQFGDNNNFVVSQNLVAPNTNCVLQPATNYDGSSVDGQGATDGIYIAGASILTSIGDISKFAPYELVFTRAVNLKELLLGSSEITNSRSNSITGIGSCSLLQTLNVTNMSGLTQLDLHNNTMLEYVYAGGTGISNLLLPEDGVLKEVVLGPATTNIKIVNHRQLNSLTCDNYSHIVQLWVENAGQTVMNGIVYTIFANRFNNLSSGCRLAGINWELGDDNDHIIDKLLSDAAYGKYITNTGDVLDDGYMYISGTIHVNSILNSEWNTLKERYPLLSVNYTTKVMENTIRYIDENNNTLFIDYKVPTEAIIDPVSLDPSKTPTKVDSTGQYNYVFGNFTLNNNNTIEQNEAIAAAYTYSAFDGWVFNDGTHPTVGQTFEYQEETIILYAHFVAVPCGYKAYWYDQEGIGRTLLKQLDNKLPWGTLSSSFSAPTNFTKARKVGSDYYVFTGWDKNITRLTEDIEYYATWEKATINLNESITNFKALSAADLYAISQQEAPKRIELLQSCLNADYTIELGHDFNYVNISDAQELIDIDHPRAFSGEISGVWKTAIKPLENNAAFTLAIDYKFLLNSTYFNNMNEMVLASCYYDDNINKNGFRLSLVKNGNANPYIRVIWGQGNDSTQRTNIDELQLQLQDGNFSSATGYRNIVVLRHPENSSELYVYYRNPSGVVVGTTLGAVTTPDPPLTYANSVNNDMPLMFGGNCDYNLTSIQNNPNTRRPAYGVIYWAKYWPADLGATDCTLLAAWPHEKITYRLGGYNDGKSDNSALLVTDTQTRLNFVPLQAIGQRYYDFNTNGFNTTGTNYGWSTTKVRDYCNSVLIKAFPVKFQSIIFHTLVSSTNYDVNESTTTSEDYLYLSSAANVDNTIGSPYTLESYNGKMWPWLIASNLPTTYRIDTESSLTTTNLESIQPLTIRFFDKYLSADASIYYMSSDPSARQWTYNDGIKNVQSGDMWIRYSTSGGQQPTITGYYIYINSDEKAQGINYSFDSSNGGGWVEPIIWATRTYDSAYAQANNNNNTYWLYRVGNIGTLSKSPSSSGTDIYKRALCPEFSI